MTTILPRTVLWLLAGFVMFPAQAADTASYPPTTTEGEIRTLVQTLHLARPRLLVSPGEWVVVLLDGKPLGKPLRIERNACDGLYLDDVYEVVIH